jgi:hypothetical protein
VFPDRLAALQRALTTPTWVDLIAFYHGTSPMELLPP